MTRIDLSFIDGALRVDARLKDLRDFRKLITLLEVAKDMLPEPREENYRKILSPEHESLRAVGRCLLVNLGEFEGRRQLEIAVERRGADRISGLSADAANACRKELEVLLPACAA